LNLLNHVVHNIGLGKRKAGGKDDVQTKIDKSEGKKQRLLEEQTTGARCSSCGEVGHKKSTSTKCRNHKLSVDETLRETFGSKYERFTRKLYLDSVIRPEYKNIFVSRIIALSELVRNVIYRAQLFVNLYLVKDQESSFINVITQQNFWYSVCQSVMGIPVRNESYKNHEIILAFGEMKEKYSSIVYDFKSNPARDCYSDALSAACKTTATTYLNHIVENTRKRILYYLTAKFSSIYTVCFFTI
jgi:hypothetical protein